MANATGDSSLVHLVKSRGTLLKRQRQQDSGVANTYDPFWEIKSPPTNENKSEEKNLKFGDKK